ncbi:ribonuclease H-like domain-containing protein [Tanacetum coccineum]
MILMRMKKFYKKTGRNLQFDAKKPVGFDKIKVECHNCHKTGHFARECRTKGNQDNRRRDAWNSGNKNGRRSGKQEDSKALVTIDGKGSDTEMSANDKFRLGYGDHRYYGILSYENEVLQSVFMSKESDFENQSLYDRFVTAGGMHVVPPPMIGNYMPSGPNIEIDYSQFTTETPELVYEPVVNEPNIVCQPKVWSNAPFIEEETVKNIFTHNKNPKVDKKGLGYGFTTRACFVCGSLSHLIRDCDFHEKRMAKQAELNNRIRKKSSQREIRPIWNNVQRMNHKNQFVPSVVLIKTGTIPVSTVRASGTNNVSTARYNFNRQAVPTNAAMKVNTVNPNVKRVRPKTIFHKTHSPFSRPFNNTIALRTKFSKQKVNTAKVNAVGAVGRQRETAVKPSAGCNWRPQRHHWHKVSKYNGGSSLRDYAHDWKQGLPCREYQDFNGGLLLLEDHFNLFSVSQMCDKKNKVLFTDSECLVLSPEFKLPDANQVLLRIPRQNNMYSFNLENIVPLGEVYLQRFFKMTTLVLLVRKESNTRPPVRPNQFSWVFFLRTKDETSGILKDFIRQIENQLNQKVKTIRCDNGTEFKNRDFIEFCGSKGIKREYSNARTPQQNGVAERKNRTLIEAARTMLADSFLPNTFWAEAVSTACYVLNRVLVTKPHNKTPYELVTGKIPIISYIRPFGCHVTILNTIDHLGKFDGKSDEGFLVGYSLQSKAFRVYNLETKRVEENLHITFLENKPNVVGKGPTWLFDLDYLTDSMNYQPVRLENQATKHAGPQEANHNAGTKDIIDACDYENEAKSAQDYFVLPIWSSYSSTVKRSTAKDAGEAPNNHPDLKTDEKPVDKEDQVFLDELERLKRQEQDANDAAEALRKDTASPYGDLTNPDQDDLEIPALEEIYENPTDGIFTNSSYDDEGAVADFTNLEPVVNASPIPTSRINSIHPSTLILRDPQSAVKQKQVTKSSRAHAFVSYIQKQRRNNHKDFQHCLFACFLSQNEPKKFSKALEDESWVDAMQEELLQFKIQKV